MESKVIKTEISTLGQQTSCKIKALLEDPRIKAVMQALEDEHQLFLVGGSIRDTLLGLEAKDIDLAINLSPEEIKEILEKNGIRAIPTGAKHLTITAIPCPELKPVEISALRTLEDSGNVVAGGSIADDLLHRDFTINAIAISLRKPEYLIHPIDALNDIKNKLIRAVLSPNTCFEEDPLRLMRFVRLSCTKGLKAHSDLLSQASAHSSLLRTISKERVRDEFSKIVLSENPVAGMQLLYKTSLLEVFLPECSKFYGFVQNRFHKDNLWEHTLEVLKKTPCDLILRLSAIFHDVGKPETVSMNPKTNDRNFFKHESVGADMTESILKRLKYDNETVSAVTLLVQTHMRPTRLADGGYRRLIRDLGEQFNRWRTLKEADASSTMMDKAVLADELKSFDENVTRILSEPAVHPLKNLAINGKDLIEMGVGEGPVIGEILRALHERVLDDPNLNEKEVPQDIAKKEINYSRAK